jgi:hypothetical protein
MKRLLPLGLFVAVLAGCSGAHSTGSAALSDNHSSGHSAGHSRTADGARPVSDPSSVQPAGPPVPSAQSSASKPKSTRQPAAGSARPGRSAGPLVRDGKTANPVVKAAAQPFNKEISYSDGVRLQVPHIAQQTDTGQGPGARPGDPVTVFTVRITNNSAGTLNLDRVVVNVGLDNGSLQAQPAYVNGTNDFSGSVASHASSTTAYAFTIPTADLGAVVLTVDFDGRHAAATFTGSIR